MRRKPLSGAIIGILVGVAVALILTRQGIWPPDQLTVFLLPALTGLLGMAILSIGREDSAATMVVAFLILVPMLVWGALGVGAIGQNGELEGGCTVTASTDIDSTTVTDTSRSDPFEIDPDGGLTWQATSPEAFMDYEWEIHAIVGGIRVPIESDTEANEDADVENGGAVPSVDALAAARGIDLDLYTGVHQVGGSAAACEGFGFVQVHREGIDPFTIIAIVVIVLLTFLLLILFYVGRRAARETSREVIERSQKVDINEALGPYEAGSDELTGGDDRS